MDFIFKLLLIPTLLVNFLWRPYRLKVGRSYTIVIAFAIICLLACGSKKRNLPPSQSDFSLYIPQADIYVTTSKRANAKFFVMFSRKPGIGALSESISYIECETMNSDIVVIFNPYENKNIYVTYPTIKTIHKTDLNLQRLTEDELGTQFYEKRIRTNPPILKKKYIALMILPATYTIILQRDTSFKNQTRIKEGDIYGGW